MEVMVSWASFGGISLWFSDGTEMRCPVDVTMVFLNERALVNLQMPSFVGGSTSPAAVKLATTS